MPSKPVVLKPFHVKEPQVYIHGKLRAADIWKCFVPYRDTPEEEMCRKTESNIYIYIESKMTQILSRFKMACCGKVIHSFCFKHYVIPSGTLQACRSAIFWRIVKMCHKSLNIYCHH